ncbi:hypothetical protein [Corallococcus sp. M7]
MCHPFKTGRPLHILNNCAGLQAPRERVRDARGYEARFATNHLGHFQRLWALSEQLLKA